MPSEVEAYSKVLPLVGLSEPKRPRKTQVLGTAFVVTDGVLERRERGSPMLYLDLSR